MQFKSLVNIRDIGLWILTVCWPIIHKIRSVYENRNIKKGQFLTLLWTWHPLTIQNGPCLLLINHFSLYTSHCWERKENTVRKPAQPVKEFNGLCKMSNLHWSLPLLLASSSGRNDDDDDDDFLEKSLTFKTNRQSMRSTLCREKRLRAKTFSDVTGEPVLRDSSEMYIKY